MTAAERRQDRHRANAVRVLGLSRRMRAPSRLAEKALIDDKAEVRSAGQWRWRMQARSSIPKLKDALADDEPIVVLAAVHALDLMHDDSAFEVYYEVLTGSAKHPKELIALSTAVLKESQESLR